MDPNTGELIQIKIAHKHEPNKDEHTPLVGGRRKSKMLFSRQNMVVYENDLLLAEKEEKMRRKQEMLEEIDEKYPDLQYSDIKKHREKLLTKVLRACNIVRGKR